MNSRCQNRTLESTISNTAEKSTRKIKDSSTRVKDNIYSYTTEKSINFNKIKKSFFFNAIQPTVGW